MGGEFRVLPFEGKGGIDAKQEYHDPCPQHTQIDQRMKPLRTKGRRRPRLQLKIHRRVQLPLVRFRLLIPHPLHFRYLRMSHPSQLRIQLVQLKRPILLLRLQHRYQSLHRLPQFKAKKTFPLHNHTLNNPLNKANNPLHNVSRPQA